MHKAAITILAGCILLIGSCSQEQPEPILPLGPSYEVTPLNGFNIFGFDVDRLMSKTFGELEKALQTKSKVDDEVGIVFIEEKPRIGKKDNNRLIEDYMELVHGPIEDLAVYEQPRQVYPNTFFLRGVISIDEDSVIKEIIREELLRNLPDDSTTKEISRNIANIIFAKENDEVPSVLINFNMQNYRVSKFHIGLITEPEKNTQIVCLYLFSLLKDPYPGYF